MVTSMNRRLILTTLISILFTGVTYAQYKWHTYSTTRGRWTGCIDSKGVPVARSLCEVVLPRNPVWRPYSTTRYLYVRCEDEASGQRLDDSICRSKYPPRYEWRTYSTTRGSSRTCIEQPRNMSVNESLCARAQPVSLPDPNCNETIPPAVRPMFNLIEYLRTGTGI